MLPIFQSADQIFTLMQTKWASLINPLLNSPESKGFILKDIAIASGANIIDHRLGRPLQGWQVVRMQGAFAELYDTQATNPRPNLTLNLTSNAATVIDLKVF